MASSSSAVGASDAAAAPQAPSAASSSSRATTAVSPASAFFSRATRSDTALPRPPALPSFSRATCRGGDVWGCGMYGGGGRARSAQSLFWFWWNCAGKALQRATPRRTAPSGPPPPPPPHTHTTHAHRQRVGALQGRGHDVKAPLRRLGGDGAQHAAARCATGPLAAGGEGGVGGRWQVGPVQGLCVFRRTGQARAGHTAGCSRAGTRCRARQCRAEVAVRRSKTHSKHRSKRHQQATPASDTHAPALRAGGVEAVACVLVRRALRQLAVVA